MEKETVINELEVSKKVGYAIVKELAESNVNEVVLDEVISMAVSFAKLCLTKAFHSAKQSEQGNKVENQKKTKDKYKKQKDARTNTESLAIKAAELADKMVAVEVHKEAFLAKKEGREFNSKKLMKTVRRIVRACFKDVPNVDLSKIDVDLADDKCNIIIPKNDEK